MKILVNNEEISITLEGEKTIGEVYQGISKKFSDLEKQISSVRVNGNYINIDKEKDLPLENIKEIHFDIVSTSQLFLDSLIEISNYLHRALNFLQGKKENNDLDKITHKEKNDMLEGTIWMVDSLAALSHREPQMCESLYSPLMAYGNDEKNLFQRLQEINGNFQENAKDAAFYKEIDKLFSALKDNIDALLGLLKKTIPTEENLIEKMALFAGHLSWINETLSSITNLIHQGKDSTAFEQVDKVSQALEEYLVLIPVLEQSGLSGQILFDSENAKNLQEVNTQLMQTLNSLADAMENNDSVSITDICEYEMPELLSLIPKALSQLKSHYN